VAEGATNRMVAWQNRDVVDVSLSDVVAGSHVVAITDPMVKTARGLSICLGD